MDNERRRRSDEALFERVRDEVRSVVQYELGVHHSLKKNGDTGAAWLNRVMTPDRVMLILTTACSLIFVLGGKAVKLETVGIEALETAKSVAAANVRLTERQAASDAIIESLATAVERGEATHATKADVAALSERIKLLVTRQEMRGVMNQEVIPRLKGIEAQIERQGRP